MEFFMEKQEEILPLIRGSWYIAEAEDKQGAVVLSDSSQRGEGLWTQEDVKEYLTQNKSKLSLPEVITVNDIGEYPKLNIYSDESRAEGFHLGANPFSYRGNYWISPSIAKDLSGASAEEARELDGFVWLVKYRNSYDRGTNPIYSTSVMAKDDQDLRDFFNHPNRSIRWWVMGHRPLQERALEAGLKLTPKIIFTEGAIAGYQADIKEHEDRKAREDLARQFSRW